MILVPNALFEDMQRTKETLSSPHPLPYKPEETAAVRLGHELDGISEGRGDLTPMQRAALYGQELHRYKTYLEKAREPNARTPAPPPPPTATRPPAEVEPPAEELIEQIIQSAPKLTRGRAKNMIQHIQRHPDVLSWDEKGRVKYRGKTLPNTNVVDLIGDAVRDKDRKGFRPQRLEMFSRGLSEMNVPREYVRNPKFIKHLINEPTPKKTRSTVTPASTPVKASIPVKASTPLADKGEDTLDEESGFYDTVADLNDTVLPSRNQSDIERGWLNFSHIGSPTSWFGKK